MRQYAGEEKVYVPDFEGKFEACPIKTGAPQRGELVPIKNAIVFTDANELLDLLQQAVESSFPTLTRGQATSLLIDKGITKL